MEVRRGHLKWGGQQKECVKRRAELSLKATPGCEERVSQYSVCLGSCCCCRFLPNVLAGRRYHGTATHEGQQATSVPEKVVGKPAKRSLVKRKVFCGSILATLPCIGLSDAF